MKIDKHLVEQLARLSKLEFDEASKEEIIDDLDHILSMVEKLNELNTDGVKPLKYLIDERSPLRADVVKQSISKTEALKNAPLADSDYIKVPKVIKK